MTRTHRLSLAIACVVGCAQGGSSVPDAGAQPAMDSSMRSPDADRADSALDDGAAPFDASIDAAPSDAAPSDAAPSDASPADGVGDASESCLVDCTDDVDCTIDTCDPVTHACTNLPDDTRCGAGSSCDALMGCMVICRTPCDYHTGCGCDGGESCYPGAMGDPECHGAGTSPTGAACTRDADCLPGHGCVELDALTSACLQICQSSADCRMGSTIGTCAVSERDVSFCPLECDLTTSAGCPGSTVCRYHRMGAVGYTRCEAEGSGVDASLCTSTEECASGLVCDEGECRHYCELRSTCTRGRCSTSGLIRLGGVSYGTCRP